MNLKNSKMELVDNCPKYYGFIASLRTHPALRQGFIEQVAAISPEQQAQYMARYGGNYFICLVDGAPAGFVGEIDGDIRIATSPEFQKQGVALFMIRELLKRRPHCHARVKRDNQASLSLFLKAGFEMRKDWDGDLIFLDPPTPSNG